MIGIDDFDKVEMRVGTVIDCKINKKAKKPAYALLIDFGEFGTKKSSAQITTLYKADELLGQQVICCTNLSPIHIGDITSEVRILGTESKQGVVLLAPNEKVENGDRVF